MRCSIYGKNLNEWDELARWLTANDLHKPLGGGCVGEGILPCGCTHQDAVKTYQWKLFRPEAGRPRNPIKPEPSNLESEATCNVKDRHRMDRGLLCDLSNMEIVKSTENPRV